MCIFLISLHPWILLRTYYSIYLTSIISSLVAPRSCSHSGHTPVNHISGLNLEKRVTSTNICRVYIIPDQARIDLALLLLFSDLRCFVAKRFMQWSSFAASRTLPIVLVFQSIGAQRVRRESLLAPVQLLVQFKQTHAQMIPANPYGYDVSDSQDRWVR